MVVSHIKAILNYEKPTIYAEFPQKKTSICFASEHFARLTAHLPAPYAKLRPAAVEVRCHA